MEPSGAPNRGQWETAARAPNGFDIGYDMLTHIYGTLYCSYKLVLGYMPTATHALTHRAVLACGVAPRAAAPHRGHIFSRLQPRQSGRSSVYRDSVSASTASRPPLPWAWPWPTLVDFGGSAAASDS